MVSVIAGMDVSTDGGFCALATTVHDALLAPTDATSAAKPASWVGAVTCAILRRSLCEVIFDGDAASSRDAGLYDRLVTIANGALPLRCTPDAPLRRACLVLACASSSATLTAAASEVSREDDDAAGRLAALARGLDFDGGLRASDTSCFHTPAQWVTPLLPLGRR